MRFKANQPARWLVIAAILAAGCWWIVVSGGAAPPAAIPLADGGGEVGAREPEQRLVDVGKSGEGMVRTRAEGPRAEGEAQRFESLGPLSSDGLAAAIATVEKGISRMEAELSALMDERAGHDDGTALNRYAQQLKLIRDIEFWRAARAHYREGTYFTYPITTGGIPRRLLEYGSGNLAPINWRRGSGAMS